MFHLDYFLTLRTAAPKMDPRVGPIIRADITTASLWERKKINRLRNVVQCIINQIIILLCSKNKKISNWQSWQNHTADHLSRKSWTGFFLENSARGIFGILFLLSKFVTTMPDDRLSRADFFRANPALGIFGVTTPQVGPYLSGLLSFSELSST